MPIILIYVKLMGGKKKGDIKKKKKIKQFIVDFWCEWLAERGWKESISGYDQRKESFRIIKKLRIFNWYLSRPYADCR